MFSSSRDVSPQYHGALQPNSERKSRADGSDAPFYELMMSPGVGDRSFFLRTSRDIEHVKQHGRRLSTACFNVLICKIEAGSSRVGIVVGKRFGIAVRRNRVKRLFRELSRQVRGELAADHALLVFPKREALTLPFQELKMLWRSTLRRQGVLSTPEQS